MNTELRWRGRGSISMLGSALMRAVAEQLGVDSYREGEDVVVRGEWPSEAWVGTEALSIQARQTGWAISTTGLARGLVALAGGTPAEQGVFLFDRQVELDLQVGVLTLRAGEQAGR